MGLGGGTPPLSLFSLPPFPPSVLPYRKTTECERREKNLIFDFLISALGLFWLGLASFFSFLFFFFLFFNIRKNLSLDFLKLFFSLSLSFSFSFSFSFSRFILKIEN